MIRSPSDVPEAPPLPGWSEAERRADKTGAAPLSNALDELSRCRWCGGWHPTACPFIKRATWHENGVLAAIDLLPRADLLEEIIYSQEDLDEKLAIAEGKPSYAELESQLEAALAALNNMHNGE